MHARTQPAWWHGPAALVALPHPPLCRGCAPPPPPPQVHFAPGPWSDKYRTHAGHPDHEGELARQRRSMGAGWGRDLTPSAVRAVEAELGEACRPSIDRLKRRWAGRAAAACCGVLLGGVGAGARCLDGWIRCTGAALPTPPLPTLPLPVSRACRVGLLPLRKRPREYYILINGGHLADPAAANGSGPDAANGGGPGGSSSSEGSSGSSESEGEEEQPVGKKARGAQRGAAAKQQQQQPGGGAVQANGEGAASRAAKQLPPKLKQQQGTASKAPASAAAAAKGLLPKQAAGAALPPVAVTFGRKRGAADAAGSSEQQNGGTAAQHKGGGAPAGKRGSSQRLGGLSGPVGSGLLGTFSKR